MNQKEAFLKDDVTRRLVSRKAINGGLETQSAMYCSPGVVRSHETSITRNRDASESLQKNMLDTNLKPETPFAGKNDEAEYPLSRDEIVFRRKLKVAARKQIKKLEKQQINKKATSEHVEKSGFSLQLASEDFPTLDSLKTKKRTISSNQDASAANVEKFSVDKSSVIKESKSSTNIAKSWKPKVKDPIQIDLSQALQNTAEKHKPVLKKTEPPTQRNLLSGNILDSDNPKRNKGKVRPHKVQKPSKLKGHILNERKKKLSDTKENNNLLNEDLCSNTPDKDDIKSWNTVDSIHNNELFTSFITEAENIRIINCEKQSENNENVICSGSVNSQNVTSPVTSTPIHSRRFREYCTNFVTEELTTSVCALLEKIACFQDRMYAREPIKASAKRRYVAGINQVSKYLQVRKVKLLVLAPDLERNPGEGGLDEKVNYFKMEAESQSIPCVFGPNRKRLGKAVKKNTLVSCVAVLSYEGAEEQFANVLEALHEAKAKYLTHCGFHEESAPEKPKEIDLKAENCYASASDVTSSLLAVLREELPPADRLLKAIQHNGSGVEE